MVGMATEDMVDTTVASDPLKQSPLQLLKLMPMLIASDMDTATEDMADTMEDMVDTAMEDMVDTTVASDLLKQSPLLMLNLLLMLMPIAMVATVATEVMVDTMVDTVDMVMVDMATGDKQINSISS